MSQINVNTIANASGTSAATIDSGGFMFPKLPHFLIRNTTAQTISTGTYTRCEFDNTVLDTHSFADLSNNRITFNSTTAGVYSVQFGGKYQNISANRVGYWIRKEGSMNTGPYIGYFEAESSGQSYVYPTFNFIYQFNSGDFLELDLYHTHGSDVATYPVSQAIGFFMSGFRIG